jgi:hypothetical protein
VQWVWPWGSGRPTAVRVTGFVRGRDVLHLDLDPAAFRGPMLVRARPSQDLCDGLVTVNGLTLAVVAGVPGLRDSDLRLNRTGISALARHAAVQEARRVAPAGQAVTTRPVTGTLPAPGRHGTGRAA